MREGAQEREKEKEGEKEREGEEGRGRQRERERASEIDSALELTRDRCSNTEIDVATPR